MVSSVIPGSESAISGPWAIYFFQITYSIFLDVTYRFKFCADIYLIIVSIFMINF